MRIKPLTSLYARYATRNRALRERFFAELPPGAEAESVYAPIHKDGQAYQVIRLQHLWGEFCRELLVRSAVGGSRTRTGQTLPRATEMRHIANIRRALSLKEFGGPGKNWENPVFAIRQAELLGVVNRANIDLGLGSASEELENIKCVRNYLTHPNDRTNREYGQMVKELGFETLPPGQFLAQRLVGGDTVLEYWLSTLNRAAWTAIA